MDERGLDEMDRRLLDALITKYQGGPVGPQHARRWWWARRPATLEDVYEPFLIQEGFIKRTSRGREATPLAYRHLGLEPPAAAAGTRRARGRAQPELPLP